ncbi:PREDICTED: protein FAM161A isoform X3 [Condylura cristata]|uniref:protein FAM161A isoform X3 n=1 Tax=Condylura cristata TaxID=143302 RepID=UPI0006432315|nr:PREDICTED: protein FAM161A isoform X3 [Condylura cristata]
MAASHGAGKPAVSRHQSPINPTTGALAAQPKSKDSVDDRATTAAALEKEKEEEVEKAEPQARAPADFNTNFSGVDEHVNSEDFVDFSDICHSNEEYFRKLEELKAAHMETMAKLEKMYQNKLNLKGVQPVVIREGASSVSSGSVSEKNSYHPVSLVTSFSEPNLCRSSSLIMLPSEDELPNLEKEHPEKNKVMSYAEELINNMWTDFSVEDYIQYKDVDLPAVEKAKKKPKEWVPKITVPEPFQMTIREQKKKEEDMKCKSDIELLYNALEKEDSECKKKFRANPVPTFIFFPPYHDLLKQNEEQRRFRKEKNKEALLASQKPFKFIAREEQKQAIREKQLRDFLKCKKKMKRFKAKPIPRSTYALTTNGKLKEHELCGNTRTQELLRNSSPLSDNLAYENSATWKPRYPEQTEKLRGKHKVSGRSIKQEKILADSETDEEENLKETQWPYPSPRHKSQVRSASAKPIPWDFHFPVPTASSRGREQATRKSEKERMREYQQELKEREEKLKNRPLLFERVAQKNARMAAEKHYFNTLKVLGISDEFVSKKGQRGKAFEYFSNQEMKSFTGDEESLNDQGKIKETENGEENSLIDTSSQDSCKEKDEADEESEEKSLEK